MQALCDLPNKEDYLPETVGLVLQSSWFDAYLNHSCNVDMQTSQEYSDIDIETTMILCHRADHHWAAVYSKQRCFLEQTREKQTQSISEQ